MDIKSSPAAFTILPVELSCSSPSMVIFCNPFLFREDVTYTLWLDVSIFSYRAFAKKTSWKKRNHNQRLDCVPSLAGFYCAGVREPRAPFVTFFIK